jgi:hypothetical protein
VQRGQRAASTIVVNTGARDQTGISKCGKTLSKALPQLKRKLVFSEPSPMPRSTSRRNMYLGTEKKFELYNGSRVRAAIENKGWLTIAKAVGELSLGDRMELERCREDCKTMLFEVMGG